MTPPPNLKADSPSLAKQVKLFFKILFVERRLPGRFYLIYYNFLHAIGIEVTTIRVARGVRLRGFTNSLSMAHETWSKRVYDHPGFALRPNMHVIDIGANQGFYSTYAASFGANVYAFEPCLETFELLQHNIKVNHFQSLIKAQRAAVSGQHGTVELFVGIDSKGGILSGSASIMNPNRGGIGLKSESVVAMTLGEIFAESQIPQCDFLKIDCEGAEYEILANLSPELSKRIMRVSIETHSGRGQEAVDRLKSLGFAIIEFEDGVAGFIKAHRNDTLVPPA